MRSTWNSGLVMRIVRQQRRRQGRSAEEGLTFIELLMAMTLLTVGLSAILGLIAVAMGSNNRNKKDTTAILLTQNVVELLANVPASVDNRTITLTDCAGTNWTIVTTPGGAPLESGTTNIDFSTAYTAAGYSMRYVTCGPPGQMAVYDVRWNIDHPTTGSTTTFLKRVTVAARQSVGSEKQSAILFAMPVQVKTVMGI
jgi:Tfp pilus assembly protein PilV